MSRGRFVLFAMAAIAVATTATLGALFVGDLYLHRKYMDLVGLNTWGYRGPAAGSKQPGEWRLAFLGGSTAFGYGVHWRESIPTLLQERLNLEGSDDRQATVLNLAYNSEGAHSYRFTLEDYAYLDYDAVVLYTGYNDLGTPNTQVFRHGSAVFRLAGYLPLFPMIFQEKAMVIRHDGRLEDAYWGRKTTFVPNIAQRATATALETAVRISESLDRQFASADADVVEPAEGGGCGYYGYYCQEMHLAITLAHDLGKPVLVVSQPYLAPRHREQQTLLRRFLERQFEGGPSLRFASMGDEIDLEDPTLAYDGMHLTAAGNQRIADALEDHVRGLRP